MKRRKKIVRQKRGRTEKVEMCVFDRQHDCKPRSFGEKMKKEPENSKLLLLTSGIE